MQNLFSSPTRSLPRRSRSNRARRISLERLEGRQLLTAVAPPNGMVSWWTGENTAADLMALNNGTMFNGANVAAGKVGQAFNFDGVDDNLQAPTIGLPTGSADRTIELWARIDQHIATEGFFEAFFASYGAPGSANQAYALGTVADGRVFVSTWGHAITGPALQTGRWYHVAATNEGQSFKLYLDGVQVASGQLEIDTPAGSTLWLVARPWPSSGIPAVSTAWSMR